MFFYLVYAMYAVEINKIYYRYNKQIKMELLVQILSY